MEDQPDKNNAEEPAVEYRKITVSTLEEQSELQIKYWASLTPEERFNDFYNLMYRFFEFKTTSFEGAKLVVDK